MFLAVNSPTPRVLWGMVVSGGGVRLLGVGGCAQSGAVELSCPLGLWCAKLVGNVLWRVVWPAVRSSWGSKKGGSIEPPIVGRFALALFGRGGVYMVFIVWLPMGLGSREALALHI